MMNIGIDISQTVYSETGVANSMKQLVEYLLKIDTENNYTLFFSSLRNTLDYSFINELNSSRVKLKSFKMPPTLLDLIWNKLHIFPIEWFIGDVDVFISSDWTQPPTKKAKKATVLHDLLVYKFSDEMDQTIVQTQKKRLQWVKTECDIIFCVSESTKKDAMEVLGIDEQRLMVVYPGV